MGKVSILTGGYALVPLKILEDKSVSNYSFRAYVAISADWAKMGHSRVNFAKMTQVSGWPLKTCQRAILGLSRYVLVTDHAGKTLTDVSAAEDVFLWPKTEVLERSSGKSLATRENRSPESDAPKGSELGLRGDIYYYANSNIYHHSSPSSSNNKTPYIYDHKSTTEDKSKQEELSPGTKLEHGTLPESMGNSWLKRVVKVYQILWLSTYGRLPGGLNYARVGSSLKPLKENFTEYQLALMLIQYFQWYGVEGDDDFIYQKLHQNTFPLTWFPNYVDSISVSLRDSIDDGNEVKQLVDSKLSQL